MLIQKRQNGDRGEGFSPATTRPSLRLSSLLSPVPSSRRDQVQSECSPSVFCGDQWRWVGFGTRILVLW